MAPLRCGVHLLLIIQNAVLQHQKQRLFPGLKQRIDGGIGAECGSPSRDEGKRLHGSRTDERRAKAIPLPEDGLLVEVRPAEQSSPVTSDSPAADYVRNTAGLKQ